MNYMVANRVATLGAASLTDAADRPGAKKLAGFFKGYAGQGIASGLAEIERFLGSHPNFSGSDKLGEGDVCQCVGCTDVDYDRLGAVHYRSRQRKTAVQDGSQYRSVDQEDARAGGVYPCPGEDHQGGKGAEAGEALVLSV